MKRALTIIGCTILFPLAVLGVIAAIVWLGIRWGWHFAGAVVSDLSEWVTGKEIK